MSKQVRIPASVKRGTIIQPGDSVIIGTEYEHYATDEDISFGVGVEYVIATTGERGPVLAYAKKHGRPGKFENLDGVLYARNHGRTWSVRTPQSGLRQRTWLQYLSDTPAAAFANGLAGVVTFQFDDEIKGTVRSLINGTSVGYEIDRANLDKQLLRSKYPISSFGGPLAGSVVLVLALPEGAFASAPSLFVSSVGLGALSGAGENNANRLEGAFRGALTGPLLGLAGKGIEPAVKYGAPILSSRIGATFSRLTGRSSAEVDYARSINAAAIARLSPANARYTPRAPAAAKEVGGLGPTRYVTDGDLLQSIATRADNWGVRGVTGNGPVVGTYKHGYAEAMLNRHQRMFEDRGLTAEARYVNGNPWQVGDPLAGSIRLDVVKGPLTKPSFVWDYKFGGATLSQSRITTIQNGIPNGAKVPVLEIKP